MRNRTSEWFQTKVRYERMNEDGLSKPVTELYTVDALSHTEAEERITEEMATFVSGEFSVVGIVPAAYKEIFFSDRECDDRFYKAKLAFITIDERSMREKRTNVVYLIQADTLERAVDCITEIMRQSMTDYAILSIQETAIMDVFEYSGSSETENNTDENDD